MHGKKDPMTTSELRELALAWWGLVLAIPVAVRLGLWIKGRHPAQRAAWEALNSAQYYRRPSMSTDSAMSPLEGRELIMRECKHMCWRTLVDKLCCNCLLAGDRCAACAPNPSPNADG
jgi:hypothetical protein